jgi:uncharacterized protein (TIGR04376 family)
MGLFDDFGRFIEERLDEYMKNNPHLELMALEDKLRDQEEETLKLMTDLKRKESQLQDEILNLANEIQQWHGRVEKAKAAGRDDLAQPAEEHEASLLRQGNQRWGQMEMIKERMQQTQELQTKIQIRLKEVRAQSAQAQAARTSAAAQSWDTNAWSQEAAESPNAVKDLEKKFTQWEAEEELQELKRNLGR